MQNAAPIYYYQLRLRDELMGRIARNPRYSLRSFATAIGVGASALSQILAGKRSVSTKVVERILNYLELTPKEQASFLESVIEEKKKKGLKRISPELAQKLNLVSAASSTGARETHSIGVDEFRVIADWYHYAILELTYAKNFRPESQWIAAALNISVMEAKVAIDRLISLELLERRDGTLKKTNFYLGTKDKTKTTPFHRKRQKQILEKSAYSLEHDPIEERNHSSITLCLDQKNVPAAKVKLMNLMKEIAQSLTQGSPDRVYELAVNLFPLQNNQSPKAPGVKK